MSVTLPAACTRERIERRISSTGIDLRIDDDQDSLIDVFGDAWVEVQGYCSQRYSDAQLGQSNWTLTRWTDIAVMFLCERRGNTAPDSVARRYDKAIADLEKIKAGSEPIVDAAQRKAGAPTLTNQRVRLFPHPNIVSKPSTSTGTPSGYVQPIDQADYDPNP